MANDEISVAPVTLPAVRGETADDLSPAYMNTREVTDENDAGDAMIAQMPVTIKPQAIPDMPSARIAAQQRGFDSSSVRQDDKGRFTAADDEGEEFFIGVQAADEDKPLSAHERFRRAGRGEETAETPRPPLGEVKEIGEDILTVGAGVVDLARDLPDAIARGVILGGAEALHLGGILSDEEIAKVREISEVARKTFDIPPGAEVTELVGSFMLPGGALFTALRAAKLPVIVSGMLAEGLTAAITQNPDAVDVAALLPEDMEGLGGELRDLLAIDPDDEKFEKAAKIFTQNAGLAGVFLGVLPTLKAAAKVARAGPDKIRTALTGLAVAETAEAEPEGEQVAQLGSIIRRLGKRAPKRDEPRSLVGDIDDPLFEVRQATEIEAERFLAGEGATQGSTRAININLAHIDEPEAVINAIDQTAGLYAAEIDEARRGIITNEQTQALASELGMTAEQLLKRRVGDPFNAEQALAARQILASSSRQLVDLAKVASSTLASERDIIAFRRALAIHAGIQKQVSGLTAEAGRALQSFKILSQGQQAMDRNIRDLIEGAGGEGMSRKMADKIATFGDQLTPKQLNAVVRQGWGARTGSAFLEAWINGLLSGPTTQAVNITSNSLVALWQIPNRFVATQFGRFTGEGVVPGEALQMAYGLIEGAKEGFILAGRTLRTGEPSNILTKMELPQHRAISAEAFELTGTAGQFVDMLGETIRIPGRLLVTGDEFFRAVGYRMELRAQALRQAKGVEGLRGEALARRMQEIMESPPENIRMAAVDAGSYQTFTKPLGETGKSVQRVVNSMPALRLIAPFIRTPVNIMKMVGEHSILAPFSAAIRAELAAGGARRQMAIARISTGSTAMAIGATLAAEGIITGFGPTDPEMRKIWLRTHQPNSIRIGDTWYAYGRIDPLGSFFGISADFVEIAGQLDEADAAELAVAAVAATVRNVTSKTYLRGVSDFLEVQSDPDRHGRDYIARFAGTLLPTISAQVTRAGLPGIVEADPTLRDVRAFAAWDEILNTFRSRLPGYSKDLPPRRNVWGAPIVLGGGFGPDIMSPIYTNKVKLSPIDDELMALGMPIRMPSRTRAGVELTAHEYSRFVQLAGNESKSPFSGLGLKDELTQLIKSPDYLIKSGGPEGGRALEIKSKVLAFRAQAWAELLEEDARLRGLVEDRAIERGRALEVE